MRAGKKIVTTIIAGLLSLTMINAVAHADLGAGADAFDRGDYKAALVQWQPLAEQGDALAQYNLGLLYANGWGTKKNPTLAMRWFAKAAEQGNATAQYNLALMRQTGRGVPKDVSEAVYWYKKAAAQGLVNAQNNLALMYIQGEGVRRDPAEGIRLLGEASKQGNSAAQANREQLLESLPDASIDRSSVNVRAQPSRNATVRTRAGRSTTARLLERRGDWSQLWLPKTNTVGWVANFLVKGTPDTSARTVATETSGSAVDNTIAAEAPTAAELSPSHSNAAPKHTASSQGTTSSSGRGSDSGNSGRMRVATHALNVRARPNTTSSVLTQLEFNDIVKVIGADRGWRKIRLPSGNGIGWAAAFLLDKAPPSAQVSSSGSSDGAKPAKTSGAGAAATGEGQDTDHGQRMRVATHDLNVRARSNTQSRVVARLEYGQTVEVIGKDRGWRKIRLPAGDGVGWAAAFLLTRP